VDVPLVITRAAAEAEETAARFIALGRTVMLAPCIEYEWLPPDLDRLAPFRGHAADVLVASPRAASALAAAGVDPRWRILALAPRTSAALRAEGLRVDVEVDGGGADLARLAGPGAVLFLASNLGGEEIASVRPDAVRWEAYRTLCPDRLPKEVADLLTSGAAFDVFVASPSAVRNFEWLAPGALARAREVVCHGRTTLHAVQRLGVTTTCTDP